MKPLWILTLPRSGSTYFCQMLNSTKYFSPGLGEHFHKFQIEKNNYWENLPFNAKVHRSLYLNIFDDNSKKIIEEKLPGIRYILLVREDIAAHAVSKYFVRHTKTFHCANEKRLQEYNAIPVPFNLKPLRKIYYNLTLLKNAWSNYLAGSDYLRVTYEELMENPQRAFNRCLEYLDLPIDVKLTCRTKHLDHPLKKKYVDLLRKNL